MTFQLQKLGRDKQLSGLDWAIHGYLHHVKTTVIDQLVKTWDNVLSRPRADPLQSQLKNNPRRLAMNLASALLSCASAHLESNSRQALSRISAGIEDEFDPLRAELRSHSHRMFNCYFYLLTHDFGQGHLVPVILGRTSDMFDIAKLPFHIDAAYEDTYESQVLPVTGGLTPFLCAQYQVGRAPQITNVATFLGDLAILHKREDYAQKHLSALVVCLDRSATNKPECFGAFVLSSVMLSAFYDEQERDLLNATKKYWAGADVAGFSIDFGLASRSIHSYSRTDLRPFRDPRRLVGKSLASRAHDGAVAAVARYRSKRGDRAILTAVNAELMTRAMSSLSPTGPWLHSGLVSATPNSSDASCIIEVEKLRRLAANLHMLFGSIECGEKLQIRAISALLKCPPFWNSVVPALCTADRRSGRKGIIRVLLGTTAIVPVVKGDVDTGVRLVVIRDSRLGDVTSSHTQSIIDSIRRVIALSFGERLLPSSSHPVFSMLQQRWNTKCVFRTTARNHISEANNADAQQYAQAVCAKPLPSADELCDTLLRLVEVLVQGKDSGVKSVMITSRHTTFIPEFSAPKNVPQVMIGQFQDAYLSYPSFWLFESLNHIIMTDELGTDQFRDLPKAVRYFTRRSRLHTQLKIPRVVVELSASSEKNDLWYQALTYFGVPVWEWCGAEIVPPPHVEEYEPAPGKTISVSVGDGRDFMRFYMQYLNEILRHGGNVDWISRVFKEHATKFDVMSISVRRDASPVHVVKLKPAGNNGTYDVTIHWKPHEAAKIDFCALDVNTILRDLCTVSDETAPSNERDSVELSILSMNGERQRIHDPSLERAIVRTYRRHLREERQTKEEVLGETMHELSNYLAPISRLSAEIDDGVIGFQLGKRFQFMQKYMPLIVPPREHARLRREARTSRQSVELIRTSIAIYGQRTNEADLFNGKSMSAEEGVRKVIRLVIGPAVRLAANRGKHFLMVDKWDDFMEEVIKMPQHCKFQLDGMSFWEGDVSTNRFDWRLGAQALLVTALHNAIQHFVLYVAEEIGGPVCATGRLRRDGLTPPLDITSFVGAFQFELDEERLVLRNRSKLSTKADYRDGADRAPHTKETIERCLGSWFHWDSPGQVQSLEASVDQPFHETRIELPRPFWSKGNADSDL